MKKNFSFIKGLENLNEVDLLNNIGIQILNAPKKFKNTISICEDFFEGEVIETQDELDDYLSTSDFVGGDLKECIRNWIDEDEQKYIILE